MRVSEYPGTVNSEHECELHFSVPCPYWDETYSEGVFEGYRWYDKQRLEPAFPFGFGLSYTRFRYSEPAIAPGTGPEPSATVSVTVTNTGRRTGWAVPELYLDLPSLTGVPQPPNQLKGFAKVQLAPGQSQRVSIPLNGRSFSYWSDSANGWRVAPGCVKIRMGSSSRTLHLAGKIAVGGGACS